MTHIAPPNNLDLAARLPAGTYRYLVHTLREMLPELLTSSPEDIALRDESAIARVAALCPANAAEAEVAALHVAHAEHVKACMRDLKKPENPLLDAQKCRAQAISMTRQADSLMRTLLRMQAARQKIEASQETRDRAAWTEYCALNLMAEALSPPPAPATIPEPPPPAAEVGSHSEPGEGVGPEDKEPKPTAGLGCGTDQDVIQGLSRAGSGVATQSVAAEGAGGEPKEPQPAAESTQPKSAPVKHPQPALAAISRETNAPIRPANRIAHFLDDDPTQALLAPLDPASLSEDVQPVETAEAWPRASRR